MKIALLQPLIPHYRESFVNKISKSVKLDVYIYLNQNKLKKKNFKKSEIITTELFSINVANKLLIYNFFPLLRNQYDIIILAGEMRAISTWFLLILLKFSRKKTILWGHGISAKNYNNEAKNLSKLRVVFHKLANHIWLYTESEKLIWEKYLPSNKLTALNNTIEIKNVKYENINALKEKYGIKTKFNLIYCARFITPHRRTDLILDLIEKVNNEEYGFIIIGDGELKPDFSKYKNVYDFGSVYDDEIKNELFSISDMYFQPGWVGLSIVEAMAHGRPVITFQRSEEIKHSVEYSYIEHNYNGFIVSSTDEIVNLLGELNNNDLELELLQSNSLNYYEKNLSIENMINNALNSISEVSKDNEKIKN